MNQNSSHDWCRREFLRWSSAAALTLPTAPLVARAASTESASLPVMKPGAAETYVQELFASLSSDNREAICFGFDDPLRKVVKANWAITDATVSDLPPAQQEIVERIVRGLASEEGWQMFKKQMADDYGGVPNFHPAIFGTPGTDQFEFVLTGRHLTLRADGDSVAKAAFGGPIFYGHVGEGFNEKPNHPSNVFWYQALRANEVYAALDAEQRKIALEPKSRPESDITLRSSDYQGLAVSDLSADQKQLVEQVMRDLLRPFREQDADEVLRILKANGGLDKLHLAYYQSNEKGQSVDIGNDGVWDVWSLEGPGFHWHYRGHPHVHVWVNIAEV